VKITKRQLRKIIKESNIPNPVQIDDSEELLFQVAVKIKDIMPPDDALGMADEDFRSMVVGIYDDYFDPIGEGWEPYPADLEAIKGHLTIIPEPGDLDYGYPVQEGKGSKARTTKRQPRRITREERALIEAYNSMSPRSKSLANAAKRQFTKDYPDVQVGIDGREGWITVNGKKAVNMSQASGSSLSIEDIIDQMKQAYLGHPMSSQEVPELTGGRRSSWQVRKERELGESKMRITKRQLRRIIREEVDRLNEASNWKPLSADHAAELDPKTRPAGTDPSHRPAPWDSPVGDNIRQAIVKLLDADRKEIFPEGDMDMVAFLIRLADDMKAGTV